MRRPLFSFVFSVWTRVVRYTQRQIDIMIISSISAFVAAMQDACSKHTADKRNTRRTAYTVAVSKINQSKWTFRRAKCSRRTMAKERNVAGTRALDQRKLANGVHIFIISFGGEVVNIFDCTHSILQCMVLWNFGRSTSHRFISPNEVFQLDGISLRLGGLSVLLCRTFYGSK